MFSAMKRPFVLILAFLCGCAPRPLRNVTFRVVCNPLHDTSAVFIVGDHQLLGAWNPGAVPMLKQPGGVWERSFQIEEGTNLRFKFTRGSWDSEGLSRKGVQYPSGSALAVRNDTVVTDTIPGWLDTDGGITRLSLHDVVVNDRFFLITGWRYHPGDDSTWAAPALDDSGWEIANTAMGGGFHLKSGWDGLGWFRLHLSVDSALWNQPLALGSYQGGASEIYLDGKRLYSLGTVGRSGEEEVPNRDRNPRVLVFTPGADHLIAVRYSDHAWRTFTDLGLSSGFNVFLGALNRTIAERVTAVWETSATEMIFTSVTAVLGLFHLFLFVFYPRTKENLYYAICMLGFSGITFAGFHGVYQSSTGDLLILSRAIGVFRVIAVVFGLLTFYSLTDVAFPRRWKAVALVGSAIALWTVITPYGHTGMIQDVFMVLVMLDMVHGSLRRERRRSEGSWIVGVGFAVLLVSLVYQLLVAYDLLPVIAGLRTPYLYGALALSIAMSLRLSWGFAGTNRNLERQLDQVKELSAKTLEQERMAKEKEIERRVLEADNARKTQELEEARKVQMSMLPKVLPDLPHLDIAVYMKTATEVGGDYYDFHVSQDGVLTAALGDATGHGAKAGTMVAVSKSLFHELAGYADIKKIFERYTSSIKLMNLGQLYMAMVIVKIRDHTMSASSAGMPPILIFRSDTGNVEELPLKGMPLGGFANFPYTTHEAVLGAGDTVLLMSDGFPEMFNRAGETFDYPKAKDAFERVAHLSPGEIIERLVLAGDEWAGGRMLEDDVTFVVLKVK
jgi:serine phosphatase RsbU (regulator of sigma subunit)